MTIVGLGRLNGLRGKYRKLQEDSIMFKKSLFMLGAVAASAAAFGADGSGFDASSFITEATTAVTAIVTGLGTLLTAAVGIYLAFVGYRKVREALNKA